MIRLGSRWSLAWKLPHRIECEVTALEQDRVVVQATHRCPPTCAILQMRATLPIKGEMRYSYADFGLLFVEMAEDAIALQA